MLGNFSEESLQEFAEKSGLERCPAGFWRYPPKTGLCTPVAAVEGQMEQQSRKRLRDLRQKQNLEKMLQEQDREWIKDDKQDKDTEMPRLEKTKVTVKPVVGVLTSSGKVIIISS